MKKTLLMIMILALGLIFSACQNQETKPIAKEPAASVITETPTITEENNAKTLKSSIFNLKVPANLIVEVSENYARIQNFTPDSDIYTLKDGEYFIEIVLNLTDETYSKDTFRNEYKKIEEAKFNGRPALYGTDRIVAGDGSPGVGYYVGGDNLAINISSESESGILAAKDLLFN